MAAEAMWERGERKVATEASPVRAPEFAQIAADHLGAGEPGRPGEPGEEPGVWDRVNAAGRRRDKGSARRNDHKLLSRQDICVSTPPERDQTRRDNVLCRFTLREAMV